MDYVTSLNQLSDANRGATIAIGNFDGIHRGHQALLERVKNHATRSNTSAGVLTFEPHPRALFRPDDPPFRITPPQVKRELLAGYGMDIVYAMPFNWDFASQTPEAFIDSVLVNGIRPAHIIVGRDFRFGQMRQGTPDDLIKAGMSVTVLDKIGDGDGEDVSASRIRQALRHGKIGEANALLGWEWEIKGEVVRGDQRGRELGYPTANVHLGETLHPAYGIYATYARIEEDGEDAPWLPSVTNIGIRPMFEVPVGQVETYIFDFNRDIYGKSLRVRPVEKIRGEARFDSLEALVKQIGQDCEDAKAILATAGANA